ncbi:MAG: tetratricopeptide repeat protein [Planctomycetes bacterium]|nr:tetratricopeptide repeat protein [Planctomycetota bacterium]
MPCTADAATSSPSPRSVSLPVATEPSGHPKKIKPSRASWWRLGALILIHVLFLIHFWHWIAKGTTLTPVEPSEAMYTLELGKVNAGFVFFLAAILSTFIFGRFFCGWACHVVALQDLCAWMMKKIGIHPKPFRTRLLIITPLLLGTYMFIWPTIEREVVIPLLKWAQIPWPEWLFGAPGVRPQFQNAFMTDDFWHTFPTWQVAIPFFLVCAFVTVYLMGSKAFCTYGCPYGGIFGVVDKVSFGKIVVSDACEGCGHCTATCTSNVRVHEEVRDFGKVVDPGCMKCMDCVSVCPNGALSWSFATPSILTKPRSVEAQVRQSAPRRYDLSLATEALLLITGIALFWSYRAMMDSVPLLMAAGMAACAVYLVFRTFTIFRDANVRGAHAQLKLKGRITLVGWLFIVITVASVAAAAWSGWVRVNLWRADAIDLKITTPYDAVFSPAYTPSETDRAQATQALTFFDHAGPRPTGFGWQHTKERLVRMAWLSAVAGDRTRSEALMRQALPMGDPGPDLVLGLSRLMMLRSAPIAEVHDLYRTTLERHPEMFQVRIAQAELYANANERDGFLRSADEAAKQNQPESQTLAARIYQQLGQPDKAIACFTKAAELQPTSGPAAYELGMAYASNNKLDQAAIHLQKAADIDSTRPEPLQRLAEVFDAMGKPTEAARAREQAAKRAANQAATPPPGR